jgi:mannose-6-phosphate isomerase
MWQLTNAVRHYPWGSHTVIPELLGEPSPAEQPYAELWIGAHPDQPSVLSDGTSLDKAIMADPDRLLSADVQERFGARLPFLMKVLAADKPLSLQAHPTTEQAQEGFAAEEAAGIPRDDATRTFKDPFHKPEILCALTPVEALCGFRPVEESLHCLAKLQLPELKPTIAALARIKLAPGEAVFLPAGNLHAYLCGAGIEVMASSDNVLRGGLTSKHVDLAALIEVLDFTDGRVPVIHPVLGPGGLRYPVPIDDFDLTRVQLDERSGSLATAGPQVLICTEGAAVLDSGEETVTLGKGESAFIAAGEPVSAHGPAVLYRATTGLA